MGPLLFNNIPTHDATKFGYCMPAAMASVISTLVPESTITPADLFYAKGCHAQGIGIHHAAVMFNCLGIAATAYSRRLNTVPPLSKPFRDLWLGKNRPTRDLLEKAVITPDKLRKLMDNNCVAIVCTDISDDQQGEIGHASVLTGYTQSHFLYHNTLWADRKNYRATPHTVMSEDVLEMLRHGHDYHTLIVDGIAPDVHERVATWSLFLKELRSIITEKIADSYKYGRTGPHAQARHS